MPPCPRPPPLGLTRHLEWFFSAATERDPEMMNCVRKRIPGEAAARTQGRHTTPGLSRGRAGTRERAAASRLSPPPPDFPVRCPLVARGPRPGSQGAA